jgi:hypothetical protein
LETGEIRVDLLFSTGLLAKGEPWRISPGLTFLNSTEQGGIDRRMDLLAFVQVRGAGA